MSLLKYLAPNSGIKELLKTARILKENGVNKKGRRLLFNERTFERFLHNYNAGAYGCFRDVKREFYDGFLIKILGLDLQTARHLEYLSDRNRLGKYNPFRVIGDYRLKELNSTSE